MEEIALLVMTLLTVQLGVTYHVMELYALREREDEPLVLCMKAMPKL